MDEVWLEKYVVNGVVYIIFLNDELFKFFLNVDQLIKNIISKVLNILYKFKVEEYFDYYILESEISKLFDDLIEVDSFEKFFEKVIDFLWDKIDISLKKV